jgi:hypothetical protein
LFSPIIPSRGNRLYLAWQKIDVLDRSKQQNHLEPSHFTTNTAQFL